MATGNKWRLIIDGPQSGAVNMAVDEALLTAVDSGRSQTPVLRIYDWREPTVSIGYHQAAEQFKASGLTVVRRITGGRAVVHSAELTYSIVSPSDNPLFKDGINGTYNVISGCIVRALSYAGIDANLAAAGRKREPRERVKAACFFAPSRYEVTIGGRKLVGSAQRRFKTAFLQHGSILFTVDQGLQESVFGQQAAAELMERMTSLSGHSGVGKPAFTQMLIKGFEDGFRASFATSNLTEAEEYIKSGLLA
ncbi:MAG: hypothetical protein A3J24_10140, partial [Deltaproteobacteria bacterium RIFCSPLOWO2_02_FULL_53_8]